ncbi:helix-turn-helix domain-containing protein [Microbacterium sp.]|uniref:helix-turn-helix domain-containing protein n=1 Tax=Microbacterium sp. TaxID=51671 RepID=UPI003A8C5286
MTVWDTTTLPPAEQFEFYHQVICQAFVPLRPVALADGEGFASVVETRPLSVVNRARVASPIQETHHGRREVAATSAAHYFVNLQLVGRCYARQGGTESVVSPGQFTVLDTTRPFSLDFDDDWRMLSFRVPHDAVSGRIPDAGLATSVDGSGVGAAAVVLMRVLWSVDENLPLSAADDLARAFSATVSAALAPNAPPEPVPDARRRVVVRHLQERLADPSLSVHSVSRALAMSPRALHASFEGSGDTFAATLRGLRMARAAEILADPRHPVTTVAAAVGYPDPASFTRAFRREFGEPPREYRRLLHEMHTLPARID